MLFDPTRPFSPPSLPPAGVVLETPEVLRLLNRTTKELAELNGYSLALANPFLLMTPFLIQESVASSNIENINTTVVEFIQGQLFPESEQRLPNKEVARYRAALLWGMENQKKYSLTSRLMIGVQKKLLKTSEDTFRRGQNKIENSATHEVLYTPPIATDVPRLIGEWEKFVHTPSDVLHPLTQVALAHYQFEAIHPFSDGNGRTGRILMVLQMIEYDILHFPILFVSGFLNQHRTEYYRLLREVTVFQDWQPYLKFMLDAFCTQAIKTKKTLLAMMQLQQELRETIKSKHRAFYSSELIDHLFVQPITTPVRLGEALGIHYTTASKYLHALAKANILKSKRVGKHHLFANTSLVKLLQR